MKLDLQRPVSYLKGLYKSAKDAYYNSTPILTDAEFDRLEDFLKKADPKWSGFKVGAPVQVKNKKSKIVLPIPMLSLDKVREHNAGEWLVKQGSQPVIIMDKLDGGALELVYEQGTCKLAATRGNGVIGKDVSYLIPHLKIPQRIKVKTKIILRCETVFQNSKFQKYATEFDKARNAATGVFNRSDIHPALKDVDIVVLQVLMPNVQISKGLQWAKANGFTTVKSWTTTADKVTPDKLTKLLIARKGKHGSAYTVDGLVIALNKINPHPKIGNPGWARAYKLEDSEDAPEGVIKDIVWSPSEHGLLIPRCNFMEPVVIDGSKIKYCSAYNAKFVKDNKLGPGAVVQVRLSGDIIPQVVKVVKPAKIGSVPDPKVHGEYKLDKTGVNFVLTKPSENAEFRVKRLSRFYIGLSIDGMKQGVVQQLLNAGYDNVRKINKVTVKQLQEIEGFQRTKAQKLWDSLHSVIDKPIPLITLMDASGVFPRGVGSTRLESIQQYHDLMKFSGMSESQIVDIVSRIPGFKDTTARMFAVGIPKFYKWLALTGLTVDAPNRIKTKTSSTGPLKDVNVTFTGFRDADAEALIESKGGKVVPFTSKTNVLLYSPIGKRSSKLQKAEDRGIKVMTLDEFRKQYRV